MEFDLGKVGSLGFTYATATYARFRTRGYGTSAAPLAANVKRIDASERIVVAVQEHVSLLAGHHDGCIKTQAAQLDPQRGVRAEFAARQGHGAVQPEAVRAVGIADRDGFLDVAMAEDERALEAGVQPPAVAQVPRREGVGVARRLLSRPRFFTQQRGECCDPIRIRRRLGRLGKEIIPLALDQSGVEVGMRKRRARNQPRQEADVAGNADHAVLRQGLQHPGKRQIIGS